MSAWDSFDPTAMCSSSETGKTATRDQHVGDEFDVIGGHGQCDHRVLHLVQVVGHVAGVVGVAEEHGKLAKRPDKVREQATAAALVLGREMDCVRAECLVSSQNPQPQADRVFLPIIDRLTIQAAGDGKWRWGERCSPTEPGDQTPTSLEVGGSRRVVPERLCS